jgi:molybdopterin-dependent oxidoreductase alpha subunit
MVWRRGETGYRRVSWDSALALAADRIRATTPDRLSFYVTSRGMANEGYYAFQKVARFLGTNNVDNSARICHAPSTTGLVAALGYGATTNSYTDWIGTGLLVLVGTNLAANQPVAMKYIYLAKKAGTRVVVVNPYREEGLERYWVPSSPESALFGTKMADAWFPVAQGGDAAFFTGALKHLIERQAVDDDYVTRYTTGYPALRASVAALAWRDIECDAGVPAADIRRFADLYAAAGSSVTVWSMGVTQHAHGMQNVLAIANLALALGRIGREKCGLNPIRGHSGVQGGAELGAVPTSFGLGRPAGDPDTAAAMRRLWGFDVPTTPGLSATAAIGAMHEGRIDVLWSAGGDFLQTMPEPQFVRAALERTPVRIFQDIVVNPMMLLPPGDVSLVFPAATRYETPGGVTETSTERRVIFSPEITGPRAGEARPEWEIPMLVAERVRPADRHLIHWEGTAAIREDIAGVVQHYAPIRNLTREGDQFQWGGERLCDGNRFATPDGKARFQMPALPRANVPPGMFRVATRRGRQFNSMVWDEEDSLTGTRRDAVLMAREDARRLGVDEGDPVVLRNDVGRLAGRVRISRIVPGNVQVHWPEGNVLVRTGVVDPSCGEPDYNAVVEIARDRGVDDAPAG